ncbi:MAG: hypothetical protein V1867_04425 [Candidatus Falkowbacteria bacterium]
MTALQKRMIGWTVAAVCVTTLFWTICYLTVGYVPMAIGVLLAALTVISPIIKFLKEKK